jgi:ribosomal-protein-alanine N-acetyltransferase
VIDTEHLRLRRLRAPDEPEVIAMDGDPEVMKYVGSPPGPRPPEATAERMRQWLRIDEPLGFWVVERRDDGRFLGLCALIRMPEGDDVELAYRLARASWGQGLASEAAGALVDHAFRTLRLPRLVAVTYPDNRGSQRVLEKLGFTRDGLVEYKGVRVVHYVISTDGWTRAEQGRIR